MAITYVGASTINGDIDSTFDITLPTLQANDIIIIAVMSKSLAVPSTEINTPNGYTEKGTKVSIDAAAQADDMRTALFYKRAVAGDSGATVTISRAGASTAGLYAVATVWRGATTSGDPFDTAGIATGGNITPGDVIVFPAFDPVATDVHVIYDGWKADDVTNALANFTNDATTFVIRDDQESAVANDATHGVWSADRNGNALSSISVSVVGNTGSYIGYAFALLPASGGSVTLTADHGSFAETGQAATFVSSIAAGHGSFS